jgi:putative flavoprotein involved in K+ transport
LVDVAIVGGGQAGLAASHALTARGIEHVVLERGRVGQTWRDRWDSFCLVTPNWTVDLPSHPYAGEDPDGYLPRDEIVETLVAFAASSRAPVREGVTVDGIETTGDGFTLQTSDGEQNARVVILATGAYQRSHRPPGAETVPAHLFQIDVEGYRNPAALPEGRILIVGSGQSGCQLAEELHQAGRDVVLACGRAPWAPRRIGGRDLIWWKFQDGFFEQRLDEQLSPEARLLSNPLTSGHDGGHDLHLRTLRALGVTLAGRFLGVDGNRVRFADDLLASLAWGDEGFRMLTDGLPALAVQLGVPVPEIPEPEPFRAAGPTELGLDGFGTVIFTSGFRPDYTGLAPWPEAFDALGFPHQVDGASTVVPGLFFLGVHFLRKRKSSLLMGVREDAAFVADAIELKLRD